MAFRTKRARFLAVGAVAGVAAALTVGLSAPSGATDEPTVATVTPADGPRPREPGVRPQLLPFGKKLSSYENSG